MEQNKTIELIYVEIELVCLIFHTYTWYDLIG